MLLAQTEKNENSLIVIIRGSSTLVEYLAHLPKVEGSSPATAGTSKENEIKSLIVLANNDSTVVEHPTTYPEIEGSDPADT
jgi:hypothetical protein